MAGLALRARGREPPPASVRELPEASWPAGRPAERVARDRWARARSCRAAGTAGTAGDPRPRDRRGPATRRRERRSAGMTRAGAARDASTRNATVGERDLEHRGSELRTP